jgi:dTDP-4-dehydrorhamnose reductase
MWHDHMTTARRVLVTGASGLLGSYLLHELPHRGWSVTAWSGTRTGSFQGVPWQPVDLGDPDQVAAAFRAVRPEAVIHAGAMASVADCLRNPERAAEVNTCGSARLAELAAEAGARMLLVSTDLVFDGERGAYREADVPQPLSVYGRTKAAAEMAVLAHPGSVVIRVSLLYGPSLTERPSFFDQLVTGLRTGRPPRLFADEWRTPLSLATAARALAGILDSDFVGLLHLGGPDRLSRLEMGQRLAAYLAVDPMTIPAAQRNSMPAAEPRPRDTSLDSSEWRRLFPGEPWPTWEEALRERLPGSPGARPF